MHCGFTLWIRRGVQGDDSYHLRAGSIGKEIAKQQSKCFVVMSLSKSQNHSANSSGR